MCVCACVRVRARNGGFVETCGDIPFNIIKIQTIPTTDFFLLFNIIVIKYYHTFLFKNKYYHI